MIYLGLVLGALFLLFLFVKAATAKNRADDLVYPGDAVKEETIKDLIIKCARRYGLDPAIALAICEIESSFNPQAVNPGDPSYGLFQITPALAQDFGLVHDYKAVSSAEIKMIMDPETNCEIACWYLQKLVSRYVLDVAVQMYNVGEAGYLQGRRASGYLERFKVAYAKWRAAL